MGSSLAVASTTTEREVLGAYVEKLLTLSLQAHQQQVEVKTELTPSPP